MTNHYYTTINPQKTGKITPKSYIKYNKLMLNKPSEVSN